MKSNLIFIKLVVDDNGGVRFEISETIIDNFINAIYYHIKSIDFYHQKLAITTLENVRQQSIKKHQVWKSYIILITQKKSLC